MLFTFTFHTPIHIYQFNFGLWGKFVFLSSECESNMRVFDRDSKYVRLSECGSWSDWIRIRDSEWECGWVGHCDWMNVLVSGSLWLNECVGEWAIVTEWMGWWVGHCDWMNVLVNGSLWLNECVGEWVIVTEWECRWVGHYDWMNVLVNGSLWQNECVGEWIIVTEWECWWVGHCDWMNESQSEWLTERVTIDERVCVRGNVNGRVDLSLGCLTTHSTVEIIQCWMIGWSMNNNWKGCGRKCLQHNLTYIPCICLEG
jgi:hypothetical protein